MLARRFQSQRGKAVSIGIAAGGYAIRGGIPLLTYPASSFEITTTATEKKVER